MLQFCLPAVSKLGLEAAPLTSDVVAAPALGAAAVVAGIVVVVGGTVEVIAEEVAAVLATVCDIELLLLLDKLVSAGLADRRPNDFGRYEFGRSTALVISVLFIGLSTVVGVDVLVFSITSNFLPLLESPNDRVLVGEGDFFFSIGDGDDFFAKGEDDFVFAATGGGGDLVPVFDGNDLFGSFAC